MPEELLVDTPVDTPVDTEETTPESPAPLPAELADDPVAGVEPAPETDWSEEVLARGVEAGFTADEIKDFGDPDRFARALAAMDRRALGNLAQSVPGTAPPYQPAAAPQRAPEPSSRFSAEPFKLQLEEGVEESLAKALTGINDHYGQQMLSVQQAVGQLVEMSQRQQTESFVREVEEMDSFVNGLSKDFAPQFGAGHTMNLTKNTAEYANRDKLFRAQASIADLYRQQGRHVPSIRTRLERALTLEFPQAVQTQARNDVNDRVEKRRAQLSHRPTRRVGTAATPDEQAYEDAAAYFKDRGIPDQAPLSLGDL